MCEALSMVHEVNFFHPYILMTTLNKRLNVFDIKKSFQITKIFSLGPLKIKYLDFANRILFFLQILFYLYISNYDLIYTRDFSFLVFLSKVPKFLRPKKKVIYEAHRIYYYTSNRVNDLKLEIECIKLADIFIAISNGVKQDLIKLGADEKKIAVIPSGVKLNNYFNEFDGESFRKENNIAHDEIIIVYAGSWEEWKGVDVLVRAYKGVLKKVNNCKLILIGGNKEELIKTRELIKSLDISTEKILLVDFVPQRELVKYLKVSDIGIIPNTKTTLGIRYTSPLKLFEYMAAGLPIVAADLPSMREILTDREALFFEPENEHDLADKLIHLVEDREKREQMSHLVRERVKDFTFEERSRKVIDVIERAN